MSTSVACKQEILTKRVSVTAGITWEGARYTRWSVSVSYDYFAQLVDAAG